MLHAAILPVRFSHSMDCPSRGTALAATAKFCHRCGARATSSPIQAAGWQVGLPWGVAGAAIGALLMVVVLRGGGERGAGSGADLTPPPEAAGSPPPPPHISQMSPQERAPPPFHPGMAPPPAGE